MADTTLKRRSALTGHVEAGLFGAVRDGKPGITLQQRAPLSMLHVDAWDDRVEDCRAALKTALGLAPTDAPVTAVEQGGTAILWVGPNRWLVVENEHRDLFAAVSQSLSEDLAAITDQGHSRVCWRISGPALRDLLAKGSSIDFHPDTFGPGDCVGTLLGHFTVVIHCRDTDSVDLYAARSFAVDVQHWLTESSLEFGLQQMPCMEGVQI